MINLTWTISDLKITILQRLEEFLKEYPNNDIQVAINIFNSEQNINPLRIQIEDLCEYDKNHFHSDINIDVEYYNTLYLIDSLITHYIELNT